jgi:hypothetical protein
VLLLLLLLDIELAVESESTAASMLIAGTIAILIFKV